MKKSLGLFLVFLGIVLLGCTSNSRLAQSDVSPVYITNTRKFYLLSVECFEERIDCLQLLNGEFGSNRFTLQCYTNIDENGIFLFILNDFGTSLGNLSYDGKNIGLDSAIFPSNLKAEYIVADLQFAYYKVEDICSALKSVGLEFVVYKNNEKEVRKIMNGKKCIESIEKSDGKIIIENFLRSYKYELLEAQ